MRHRIFFGAGACLAVSALTAASVAHAGLVVTGSPMTAVPGNNDFKVAMAALGYTDLMTDGLVTVDQAGEVAFYYHGAESGYTNSFEFMVGGTVLKTEHNEAWSFPGEFLASVAVAAGDALDIGFTSSAGVTAANGDPGFGVFLSPDPSRFIFGYGDNGGSGDADYDDMMISAVFRPSTVPEPGTLALLGLGLGALGVGRKRKHKTNPSA